MHTDNIELLRNEAQRLLQLNIEGLEQMLAAKGVVVEAKQDSKQTLDRISTQKYIEILRGELTKLKNMELVIAVVGTMKAGKSTTINAIVGTEVLPNRNRPMTALPTLIRHTPGQIEPILHFENNEPINVLFENIRHHIAHKKLDDLLKASSNKKDMKELIDFIVEKIKFRKIYQGADNIFWFLKTLNDLVRLSSELGVSFPFESYGNVEQMPVITVEFAHLREVSNTHGQLTLLDTPGPNEAGQDHLRHIFNEQLKKTSAVLAVFDYTQLQSDADEEVRKEIKDIAKLHKGRLFALVNKFDQKDRNGDGKEAVQVLVADKLMENHLERKHVFPVSSKWGYLANRAKHEIAIYGKLPDFANASWVVDFAEEALGRRWENKINDNEEIIEGANELWADSGFHDPMENVIRAAHTKVALLSVDSAAGKLLECVNVIENFLVLRRGALSKKVEELQKSISALKQDIEKIDSEEKRAQEKIKSNLEILNKKTKVTIDEAKKNSEAAVDKYFQEGKLEEKKLAEKIQRENDKKDDSWLGKYYPLSELNLQEKEKKHFNPNEKILKFRDIDKANDQIGLMQQAIEKYMDIGKGLLNKEIDSMLKRFGKDFSETAQSAEEIISNVKSEMAKDGFQINLKLPSTDKLNLALSGNELSLASKIETKTKTESYSIEKSGVSAWLARKLWGGGYETRYRDVTEYIVNLDEIKKFSIESIDKSFEDYTKKIDSKIIESLKSEVREFFKSLKEIIEKIRGDLQQGIRDQQKSKVERELVLQAFAEYLGQFQSGIPDIKKDSEALNIDIQYLKNIKVPV